MRSFFEMRRKAAAANGPPSENLTFAWPFAKCDQSFGVCSAARPLLVSGFPAEAEIVPVFADVVVRIAGVC